MKPQGSSEALSPGLVVSWRQCQKAYQRLRQTAAARLQQVVIILLFLIHMALVRLRSLARRQSQLIPVQRDRHSTAMSASQAATGGPGLAVRWVGTAQGHGNAQQCLLRA